MTFAILMSLITLGLYCMQQLGVTLAVGAETILLVAYLQSIRDGVVDDEEKGFARAVRSVKDFGLFFIILSGGALVANQFFTGQLGAFLSIPVLFKWSLIGIALFLGFVRGSGLTTGLIQGLSAGTWYALFAVHILAPEAPWMQLAAFYAIWLVGFSVCWTVLVFALRNKKPARVAVVQKSATSAIPKAAVVITPDRTTPRGEFSAKNSPTSGVVTPAYVSDKSVSAPFVAPVTVTMPKPPPPAPVPSIPKPSIPTPPPAPLGHSPATGEAPKVSAPASATPPPPSEWLHVMPRTPGELAKRKEQTS